MEQEPTSFLKLHGGDVYVIAAKLKYFSYGETGAFLQSELIRNLRSLQVGGYPNEEIAAYINDLSARMVAAKLGANVKAVLKEDKILIDGKGY